jgi:hypothetical protein
LGRILLDPGGWQGRRIPYRLTLAATTSTIAIGSLLIRYRTRMTEKHYAHLAHSYVADTVRANFPTLGIVNEATILSIKA